MNVETSQPVLLRSLSEGVATLTLNRPRQRNALSRPLMAALHEALDEIHGDSSVHVVVIEGAGDGFCAGHDLKEVRGTPTREFYETLFAECSALMMRIQSLRQPVIAKVHGVATAAGCQLVATCDLAVADAGARFATPGVNIGLFCSTPMVALTRAVPRKKAMEMLLTGEFLSARQMADSGMINRVVADDVLDQATRDLASSIASKSPVAVKIGKEAFYRQAEMTLQDAYSYTGAVMAENMMSRDAEAGIGAFIAKEKMPDWTGK